MLYNTDMKKGGRGFTIVELLIVVVVIAILAAITIVAYNGVQNKARAASLQSNLSQIYKKAEYYNQTNGRYPTDLSEINFTADGSVTFQYLPNSAVNPTAYCAAASTVSMSYTLSSTASTPVLGGCSLSGGVIASGDNPPSEGKLKAFDGSTATKWLAFSTTAWIVFSTSTPITVTSYSVTSANDVPGRDPRSWTLYGSNDRISWTPINSQSNIVYSSRFQSQAFSVAGAGVYQNYRLDITQNNGDAAATQLSEISISGATILNS